MCEMYECVPERELVLWQFLEADDDAVLGGGLVCAFFDERCAYLLELFVFEDAGVVGVFGRALN